MCVDCCVCWVCILTPRSICSVNYYLFASNTLHNLRKGYFLQRFCGWWLGSIWVIVVNGRLVCTVLCACVHRRSLCAGSAYEAKKKKKNEKSNNSVKRKVLNGLWVTTDWEVPIHDVGCCQEQKRTTAVMHLWKGCVILWFTACGVRHSVDFFRMVRSSAY